MVLTSAIDLDPSTEFIANRAQCFFEQGLFDRAVMDLSRALEIEPTDPQLLYKRGLTWYAQKRYPAAIEDLHAALQYDPDPAVLADLYFHLGVSYANIGKHGDAVSAFDQAVQRSAASQGAARSADCPHYNHERGKSLQVLGKHKKALLDLTRVLEMQPTNARALFRRAFSFKALQLYSEAAEDFEAAKEFEPEDPRLNINYRKISNIACITLGPAGHEDTSTYSIGEHALGARASQYLEQGQVTI